MVSKTNEYALESAIEDYLVDQAGYTKGFPSDFDMDFALDTKIFWEFLENTQSDELDRIRKTNPNDWQQVIISRFDKLINKNGILSVIKKGIGINDSHLTLLYPHPLSSSSDKVKENYQKNIFSVTRQIRYSRLNPLQEIDMVLFVNGIPLITLELKNAWTHQTARYHGQKQYREDRDTTQPLLKFARCMVHMTLDTDEVFMTTKLSGKSTFFLPFNKGYNEGQGNPPNPNGHRTAYLWEDVFQKESLSNIIQHFVRLDGSPKDQLKKRTLFFPRFHQLDVVRKLIADISQDGIGKTYLIQHSAGSGKTNSITWSAYQLIEAYPSSSDTPGAKSLEEPLFDSVIVVTDRRILDRQLKDAIREFSEVKNIIAGTQNSKELKEALENGKKIITTTIQRFPYIIEAIEDLSDKRFAVIIDEAHSSQSGSAHDNMNRVMGKEGQEAPEEMDAQEKILEAMKSRKMRKNASYFAFTATPKNTTLEKFGTQQADGSFEPFHLYSMKQAIEEGFILDVISNYTTYKSYYEIQKSVDENPQFDSKKAQKKLRAYVERSQQTIDTKAEIMLDHFIDHVVNTKKLRGKGKAMVVTQNIETAIRYFRSINRLLADRGNPFKAIIAFSGEKEVDGVSYTESQMNGFADSDTKDKLDTDEYRIIVVANKYLTGFDQPKLCSMYVDKKLAGVLCVQALSRLNRSAPKYGKKTEDLFVLDFFNQVDDIKAAFDPFYTSTSLSSATDVNVLHDIKEVLDETAIYDWQEVESFNELYFSNADAQQLSPIIDQAAVRFNVDFEWEHDEKADFKIKAKQFVKIYGQMAAIIPYEMPTWEKLYWFLKFLIPKLIVKDPDNEVLDGILESVDLSTYGLERTKLDHQIELDQSETSLDPQNPNPRGSHGDGTEKDPLDEIISVFNERWFQGWSATPEEQRIKFINMAESIKAHPDFKTKYQDNPDVQNRELAFGRILKDVMLHRRREELELYKLFAGDEAFSSSLMQSMQRIVGRASL